MTMFYAQPCNRSVEGFFFQTFEQYRQNANGLTDRFGLPVKELEIQFIEGGAMARELFEAWKPGQADIERFIDETEAWTEEDAITAIIALREGGYAASDVVGSPRSIGITLYRVYSLKELAEEFVEEGLFGDVPKPLENYIDHDAIARDLGNDGYVETIVAGERLVYCFE